MTPTPNQLHILRHALGLDDCGRGQQYRNRYLCGPGQDGWQDCEELRMAGYLNRYGSSPLFGEAHYCFTVTRAGIAHVNAQPTTADDFVAWLVEMDIGTCAVFAATKSKAQWIAVASYWDAYGRRKGEWPFAKARRAPQYDRSPLRFAHTQTWDPEYVRDSV